jgi:signal transduction histidine kinase
VSELERVLDCLAIGAQTALRGDGAAVRLLNEGGRHVVPAAAIGPGSGESGADPIPLEESPVDEQALGGKQVLLSDVQDDERAAGLPSQYRAVICVPLVHSGKPVGTLHVYGERPGCFSEDDVASLAALGDLGAAAIAAARAANGQGRLEESKAHFVRMTTHELRSPVTVAQSLVRGVIRGYGGELSDQQADALGRISGRLDHLENLVNDLLALAAGRAPELAEQEGPVMVRGSVGRAVLLLQPRAEDKGVSLCQETCSERLVVWGTEEGLDRIFVNLVSNAVKYTPSGGRVIVTMLTEGQQVKVRVEDTGIGVTPEAMRHLFDEFYRAPNAKQLDEAGTGLGLAIVKDLVERYRGTIDVESEEGKGSTFTVSLPVYRFEQ